ncbi:restriction endonuclease [Wenjunlia vitaminophila]|uniref:Restriction endonuclease n=1 Tax=Wenjunlia vitaminophila TaxID=76728 RepID=A0A0T6LLK6_WENVI|nr:Uma2 family endonuclease [Wenjunlia vitaminophila]KRV46917.1 restriction endonuclease [Wenjunlia vitaminophila]
MSALAAEHRLEHGPGWEELVGVWERTDGPEGWTVEVVEGIVTMAPPPTNDRGATAQRLQRSLYSVIPGDWGAYQTLGVSVPGRQGLYVPDLVVLPETVVARPGHHVPASEAELVVEITSPGNAHNDRIAKVHGYAPAGVPLYLLLDPCRSGCPVATLHGEPENGTYRVLSKVEYGERITLPEPFGLAVDTGEFPLP